MIKIKNSLNVFNYNYSMYLKNNYIYIYTYNKNITIIIKINNKIKNKNYNKDLVKIFLNQFCYIIYIKIKFTGKGYKIKKNTNKSMIFLFNRAHITNIWWKNIFLFKIKKYKIFLKIQNNNINIINNILNIRYINIFTKKGLRISKQILLKKKGKK